MSVNLSLYEALKGLGVSNEQAKQAAELEPSREIADRLTRIETDIRSILRFGIGAFVLTWAGLIGLGLLLLGVKA